MIPIDIVAILTALGVGSLLGKLVDWYIQDRKERKEKDEAFTGIFQAIHDVYSLLLHTLHSTRAHRVVVLKTTNGGGRPSLSSRLYSSVLYEAYDYPLNSVRAMWQDQPLDKAYMALLYKMDKQGHIRLDVADMEDGILRDLYLAEGVQHAHVFRVLQRETEYIYLSVNHTEPVDEDPKAMNFYRGITSSLCRLFEKNEKL